MAASGGTFLGLDFNLTSTMTEGVVTFFVRKRLIQKVSDMVASVLEAQSLIARLASISSLACSISSGWPCLGELGQGACMLSRNGSCSGGESHARAVIQPGGRPSSVGH